MTGSSKHGPASLLELRERIVRREIVLGKRVEAVLRFMVENPQEAAFGTCRSIATRCNVSPATVDRLAVNLGFERFAEFRDLFRQSLRDAAGRGTERANASAMDARRPHR